ncbi:hypothetical protein QJS10_CPA10g01184 [Acorus calamus]|uniref:RRM domain-containing protein n=1 Tax=Acorus calamus TaxID=4465 RepID=A0AAV9E2D6_ACOCL|nr:hypothetical protein QJS10_CPA10g01184 [Acorus calamus]
MPPERGAPLSLRQQSIPSKARAKLSRTGEPNPNFERTPLKRVESPSELIDAAAESTELKKRKREKDLGDSTENPAAEEVAEAAVKKKKKRKREEVEEIYEAKHYGKDRLEKGDREEKKKKKKGVGEKRKAAEVEEEEEQAASRDAYDDEAKLLRTVFIGNLPLKTKRKTLLKEFGGFGEVESVRFRSVPINVNESKVPRKGAIIRGELNDIVNSVHAYIVYKEERAAQASLSHNMATIGGNHIRVDMACPPRKKLKGEAAPLYDHKRTVFVGNLPFDVKDEELYQLFSGIEEVGSSLEAVRVIRDPHTSVGKGIAYALFKTREAANSVVRKRSLKLRDRDLRLCHSKSESTPSKRKDPPRPAMTGAPRRKKFASVSGEASGNRNDRTYKANATSLSYQGLRATKGGGAPKKARVRPSTEGRNRKFGSKSVPGADRRVNKNKSPAVSPSNGKRPSVAARKANELKKRKQEGGVSETSRPNKKRRY